MRLEVEACRAWAALLPLLLLPPCGSRGSSEAWGKEKPRSGGSGMRARQPMAAFSFRWGCRRKGGGAGGGLLGRLNASIAAAAPVPEQASTSGPACLPSKQTTHCTRTAIPSPPTHLCQQHAVGPPPRLLLPAVSQLLRQPLQRTVLCAALVGQTGNGGVAAASRHWSQHFFSSPNPAQPCPTQLSPAQPNAAQPSTAHHN